MKIRQVPIKVAIVIPLIGLFEEPIKPTMRDETVTKKAPKIITSKPSNNLLPILSPGIKLPGINAIIKTRTRLPIPTTLIDRSLSVLLTVSLAEPAPFNEPRLPLKDETIEIG